jgi:hypothetical protein
LKLINCIKKLLIKPTFSMAANIVEDGSGKTIKMADYEGFIPIS